MGSFCLFAYTGLTDRFRRARGFLHNLSSLLRHIRSEKNNVLILKNFLYDEEQRNFPNKNVGSALKNERKCKENPKNPPVDVIGGWFKV